MVGRVASSKPSNYSFALTSGTSFRQSGASGGAMQPSASSSSSPSLGWRCSVADPDLELGGGPGFDLLALLAFLPSVMSSLFTQNKGAPSSRSASGIVCLSHRTLLLQQLQWVQQDRRFRLFASLFSWCLKTENVASCLRER